MNYSLYKCFPILFLAFSNMFFSQLSEEKLILQRKREPEIKKIEKKKSSVEIVKNYPPLNKSDEKIDYKITNIPAVSDFKTTPIEGQDISPKIEGKSYNNFLKFGMGNYGKILFDGLYTHPIGSQTDLGLEAHANRTTGMPNVFPWESRSSRAEVAGFINHFTVNGKYSGRIGYGSNDFRYYGIYAFEPSDNVDIKQIIKTASIYANYDHYSDEILNNVNVKSHFMNDRFSAQELYLAANILLSKYDVDLPIYDFTLNADLGIGIENINTNFDIFQQNKNQVFEFKLNPKVTFIKGNTKISLGSGFSFLNRKFGNNLQIDEVNTQQSFWFPKAEILVSPTKQIQFFIGLDGGFQQNTYQNLVIENPFILSNQEIKPTQTQYKMYFGLKGDANDDVKYEVSAGLSKMKDILFFKANTIFDTTNTQFRNSYDYANTFSAIYRNGNHNEILAKMQYFPNAKLSFDALLEYHNYRLEKDEKVLNRPLYKAGFGAKYSLLDKKLHFGFRGYVVGERLTNYFIINSDSSNPAAYSSQEFNDKKLAAFTDLNLSAEYQFYKNFSVFILGNNLLNQKYQTVLQYQVIGLQITGGLKIIF